MKAKHRGALVAMLIAGCAIAPAMAAPGSVENFTIRVAYGDLDIDDPAGAKTLYRRLKYATARACKSGSYRELGSLDRYHDARVCFESTLDRLVAEVNSDTLRKLHERS
ncbi:MAG TPA: UrcA family protein [Woeseiaceae bacterium]|nr:UrcA family protein [Woeseiaceae bacterium]